MSDERTPSMEQVREEWVDLRWDGGYAGRGWDEFAAEFDRLLNDERHEAYGRGFDEGFSAGYADRSAELADQPLEA